jgi:hypothetical protein
MKFTKDSSKVNWYPGTTKQALDQGYERVTDGTDPFGYANRNPKTQGWRDAPPDVQEFEPEDFS